MKRPNFFKITLTETFTQQFDILFLDKFLVYFKGFDFFNSAIKLVMYELIHYLTPDWLFIGFVGSYSQSQVKKAQNSTVNFHQINCIFVFQKLPGFYLVLFIAQTSTTESYMFQGKYLPQKVPDSKYFERQCNLDFNFSTVHD